MSPEGQEGLRAFLEKRTPGVDAARDADRVLIANRGEIAVRVIRACRELGIESVAVYSDADADAPHVVLADRAVRIGPAAAARELSRTSSASSTRRAAAGADAVHPGYGFLVGERRVSPRACDDAGARSSSARPPT